MFIAHEVKDAVDHQKENHLRLIQAESEGLTYGCVDGDDEVTEKVRVQGGEFSLGHRKGDDVGRSIPMKILSIELPNPLIIDKQDAQLSLRELQVGQYLSGRSSNSS